MTVAVAAETRISHSVARVSATPAAAPRSLSRQVRDIPFFPASSPVICTGRVNKKKKIILFSRFKRTEVRFR